MAQIVHQPINPAIRSKLDPEYVAFHEKYLQHIFPSDQTPWNPSSRTAKSATAFAVLGGVDVSSIKDVFLKHAELRVITPKGKAPATGWPVFLWFHGGGWTLGNLDSDNGLCSRIATDANCVAINVNYRHAPEDPYPAAIDDASEALEWIANPLNAAPLGIDPSKIAVGGTSAGGNLAAVLSLRASLLPTPISIAFQVLLLPVIDNTSIATSPNWASRPHAPWLTAPRMLWYRNMYLPNASDWSNWDASPNLAPDEVLSKAPRTWIAVSEQDLLSGEALAFGEQLKGVGVTVDGKTYPGCTHQLLAFSGSLAMGKLLVADSIKVITEGFKDIEN